PSSRQTLLRNYLGCNDPDVTDSRIAIMFDSHQWSNNVVGNILGSSGTSSSFYAAMPRLTFTWANTVPQSWTYDISGANGIFRFGYPYSGNQTYSGTANPPNTSQLGYLDLSVQANTLVHGNWDYANKSILYDSSIADRTIPNSY